MAGHTLSASARNSDENDCLRCRTCARACRPDRDPADWPACIPAAGFWVPWERRPGAAVSQTCLPCFSDSDLIVWCGRDSTPFLPRNWRLDLQCMSGYGATPSPRAIMFVTIDFNREARSHFPSPSKASNTSSDANVTLSVSIPPAISLPYQVISLSNSRLPRVDTSAPSIMPLSRLHLTLPPKQPSDSDPLLNCKM